MREPIYFSSWDYLIMGFAFRWKRMKDHLIVRLGGYDRIAVGRLLSFARAAIVEAELEDRGSAKVEQLKRGIWQCDPELGRIYGYAPYVEARRREQPCEQIEMRM